MEQLLASPHFTDVNYVKFMQSSTRERLTTDRSNPSSELLNCLIGSGNRLMFWFWFTKRNEKRLGLVCLLLHVYCCRWTWWNSFAKIHYEEKELLKKQHRRTRTYRKVQISARFFKYIILHSSVTIHWTTVSSILWATNKDDAWNIFSNLFICEWLSSMD